VKLSIALFSIASLFFSSTALAQTGYNPEFLGNAAAAPRPGFSPKIFLDYFNQSGISGNDVELALEPQYWIRGFTGEEKRDYVQFLLHLPMGYRSEDDSGNKDRGWGIGTLNANVEYFFKMFDDEDLVWWFDNGISGGFPTATGKEGLRVGGRSYMVTWFQENYFSFGKWVMSISPISVTFVFKDSDTKVTPGLALNIMNSAYGYQVADWCALGVTGAYQFGNVLGSDDGFGNELDYVHRAYVGPAFLFPLPKDSSLQVSGLIDVYTKGVARGQGFAAAFWHMF
jgi:hypothetical protein